MAIFLVRHAKAGDRADWGDDDRLRPLSPAGWEQAADLAVRLAPYAPPVLLSSPYVRCTQTLEPLAARCGLPVTPASELAEGSPFESVLDLFGELAESTVLCSHGDVIPDVIQALARRGATVTGAPNWRKGSVWVLERRGTAIVAMEAWPPPTA